MKGNYKMREELLIENYAQEDYEGFVKELLRLETNLSEVQIEHLYPLYMAEDDMPLLNPAFMELSEEIDWRPVYVAKHLEHLLTYSAAERNAMVSYLQSYFQYPDRVHIWLSDNEGYTSSGLDHVNSVIESDLSFFKVVRSTYSELLTEGSLADSQATFSGLVDAAMKAELLENKEAFLKHYVEVTELEKQVPNQEPQTPDRSI